MKDSRFNFKGFFIYDMANNHQGSVKHGLRIISEIAKISNKADVRGAIKFQFRQLDTFIHPKHKNDTENKHIPRFLSTRLTPDEFEIMADSIRKNNLMTICTPFDEESVDLIMQMDLDIIKIASCSAKDWPLLEKVAETGKPVVCSTAGLNIKEIDNLVSFFDHRAVNCAIMHCVAIYPTPPDKLQLNQIKNLCHRYPHITIGFSTHENPENLDAIKIAFSKGARIFERHVGIETGKIKLNAYSSTPEQIKKWLKAYHEAVISCGVDNRPPVDHKEEESLRSLMRGVFAKVNIKKGSKIKSSDIFFAMPLLEGQLTSGQWNENMVADRDYKKGDPIPEKLNQRKITKKEIVYQAIHEIKGMLNEARIVVGNEFDVELSHHYGIERFREIGATIIECINRDYCKKLIVLLPGQKHPYHYHKKKEETFQVLSGEMEIGVLGKEKSFYPGDTLLVQPGVWHKFQSEKGVIFEEISTTHLIDDSFYKDKIINRTPREQRKTKLINWGRHQFD